MEVASGAHWEATVDDWWLNSFSMLHRFKTHRPERLGDVPIWMKIRIDPTSEEHAVIRRYRETLTPADTDFEFETHESGPEILVYLAVTAAGVSLAKSVIDLIATIVKARSETRRKSDLSFKPWGPDPLELIIRHVDERRGQSDEIIIRLGQEETSDAAAIEQKLMEALREIVRSEKQRRR
jgi:hypothetical protein